MEGGWSGDFPAQQGFLEPIGTAEGDPMIGYSRELPAKERGRAIVEVPHGRTNDKRRASEMDLFP